MKISIDEKLLIQIGRLAAENGIEAYVVGGYVRDSLLGRPRKDFDITVVGDALQFSGKVARYFKSKEVIYERFRTAMVPVGDSLVEFVGTRKEEYTPGSRKPVVSEGTLTDDLRRRDFTVNAMAVSILPSDTGTVIDLFGGLSDLKRKILRTPLEPALTYSDDPLRMMRAARFASQLDFTLIRDSFDAISEMADRIRIISQERISDEFLKIMASPLPSRGLYILKNTGLMKHIFPEVDRLAGSETVEKGNRTYGHKDVFRHTLKVVDNIAGMTDNVWLRFAALMHDIAKPKTKRFIEGTGWSFHGHEEIGARWQAGIFRRMKLPVDKGAYVEKLVRLHQRPQVLVSEEVSDSAIRRLAVQAGDALEDLFTLCRADITTKNQEKESEYIQNYETVFQKVLDVQTRDKLKEFQSPVRGEEIMEICAIPPSRLVGQIKHEIEEAIIEGLVPNEYEAAKDYFMENKEKWLGKYRSAGQSKLRDTDG